LSPILAFKFEYFSALLSRIAIPIQHAKERRHMKNPIINAGPNP